MREEIFVLIVLKLGIVSWGILEKSSRHTSSWVLVADRVLNWQSFEAWELTRAGDVVADDARWLENNKAFRNWSTAWQCACFKVRCYIHWLLLSKSDQYHI